MSEQEFIQAIDGGICAAEGVRAASVTAGIKPSGKPDMVLLDFDPPATAAGVYTQNKMCAAPVTLCRERVGKSPLRAFLVNSGNANACTGGQGYEDAVTLCGVVADSLDCPEAQVAMSSTGLIGAPLPVDAMKAQIGNLVSGLSADNGHEAAVGIMTTDTRPKEYAVQVSTDEGVFCIGGITKGAGMIAPNMATMLAYIASDAVVAQTDLQAILRAVVRKTFNCVTIDGDTSTNDTVILAATGASGVALESADALAWFEAGLYRVCKELALAIVRDGEGVNKVVEVKITGAASEEQAHLAAKSVSESLLVKTAIHGEMPNWGRIFAAAGYSGADMVPEKMSLRFENVEVMRDGAPVPGWTEALAPLLKQPEYGLELGLGVGDAEAVFWTTDLSAEYVRFNADYKT